MKVSERASETEGNEVGHCGSRRTMMMLMVMMKKKKKEKNDMKARLLCLLLAPILKSVGASLKRMDVLVSFHLSCWPYQWPSEHF